VIDGVRTAGHGVSVVSGEVRIALLIDADNAPASKLELVLGEVARHGATNIRRAYGNWKSPQLKSWEELLHVYAIRPMQQFAYSTGKNASDMAMVIDAMDLLYSGSVDAFGIFSSDADFTPLAMRLLTEGRKVYGFGEKKTPLPFVNACSVFTYVEALAEAATGGVHNSIARAKRTSSALDRRLLQMLRTAVVAATGEDGWAHLGEVGNQIGNQASFDSRNYGYNKLSELVEATGLYDLRRNNLTVWVRPRR